MQRLQEKYIKSAQKFGLFELIIAVLVIMFIVLQFRIWIGKGSLAQLHQTKIEIQANQEEIGQAKQRNDAMGAEIDNLKANNEALEGRARSELGMIKKGERFFRTVEPQRR